MTYPAAPSDRAEFTALDPKAAAAPIGVADLVELTSQALSRLLEQVANLATAISPVCVSQPVEEGRLVSMPPVETALAADLAGHLATVDVLTQTVADLRNRVRL